MTIYKYTYDYTYMTILILYYFIQSLKNTYLI